MPHIPRLINQIQRLEKFKEDILRKQQEKLRVAPLAAPAESGIRAQIRLTHSIESIPSKSNNARGNGEIRNDFRIDFRNEQENQRAAPLEAPANSGSTAAINFTHSILNNDDLQLEVQQ